ncbi:MAG: alpha/beta fold hydrolase [Actinomycetes bacterium]
MSISESLGAPQSVDLAAGRIHYRERGSGRSVVFVHGFLVNGDLWRNVVPTVAEAGYRCITPDWPLGSHGEPMRTGAELKPPHLAGIVASFLDALDLEDVVLVANDTGGAVTQLVMTQHPQRVGAVVLTNCDAFERFFPPLFQYLKVLPRVPGALLMMGLTMRSRALQRMPIAFGKLTHRPISADVMSSYVQPVRRPEIRRDIARVLRGVNKRYTVEAAEALKRFDKPVLLAWGVDDKAFRLAEARRLAAVLPDARVVPIEDSRTFVSEDQPDVLARAILDFLRGSAGVGAVGT